MRWIIIAALTVMAACQPEDVAPVTDTATSKVDQACVSQGGQMIVGGFGQLICQTPTPDAGASCVSSADCTGHCLAEGQVYTPMTPYFGCYETFENGQTATLCVD